MNPASVKEWAPLLLAIALAACSSQDKASPPSGKSAPAPAKTTEAAASASIESIPVEEDREDKAVNSIDASNVKDEVAKLEKEINP